MDILIQNTEEKMQKTVKLLSQEYSELRAGRANANVLDKIRVDYYGTPTPINQMAAVSVSEARILTIQPWDKSTIQAIEKAIQASDIGINPQNDGDAIEKAKKMEKASEITEDDLEDLEEEIQDLTDKYIKQIDEAAKEKEQEIMTV